MISGNSWRGLLEKRAVSSSIFEAFAEWQRAPWPSNREKWNALGLLKVCSAMARALINVDEVKETGKPVTINDIQ